MPRYSSLNIIYRLQKWLDSVPGQTFMNYAYSWGAAVVILGTLFKLTHLPGADIMLFVGMGTEVFVFFISAFDRPFDKTAEGRDLPTQTELEQEQENAAAALTGVAGGGTVIIGGGTISGGVVGGGTAESGSEGTVIPAAVGVSGTVAAADDGQTSGAPIFAPTPAPAVSQETAVAMEDATTTYVDRLNELNELLLKVASQSERLTRDSEEMENLNRTLTGISRIYEMQLKGASQQISTIDDINAQQAKMAAQIEELNQIYARMIEAMKQK